MSPTRFVIPHLDDVGCAGGSITAFDEVTRVGLVTSGSVIVPSPLFGEVAALVARRPDLDVGVHLVLTSESATSRWGPLTGEPGLTDADGCMWQTIAEARRNAPVESVERELRAQIEVARAAGIAVTHLDHHMGVAAAPEYVEATADLAIEYGLPMLLPADIDRYYRDLRLRDAVAGPALEARSRLERHGLVLSDRFAIGYNRQDEKCRAVYQRLIAEAEEGVTYLSLHCSAPGDIEEVHPRSAAWRVAEYELFRNPEFVEWVARSDVEVRGIRDLDRRPATGDR